MTYLFTIYGIPVPKSYGRSAAGWYKKANVRDWEKSVALAAKEVAAEYNGYLGPVQVEIVFHLPIPKSERKIADGASHCRKLPGDLTNLYKSTEDALKGVLFHDDGQVWKANLTKLYTKERPRVDVKVVLSGI